MQPSFFLQLQSHSALTLTHRGALIQEKSIGVITDSKRSSREGTEQASLVKQQSTWQGVFTGCPELRRQWNSSEARHTVFSLDEERGVANEARQQM